MLEYEYYGSCFPNKNFFELGEYLWVLDHQKYYHPLLYVMVQKCMEACMRNYSRSCLIIK